MPAAPLPDDEDERLEALRSFRILDSEPEERYDRVCDLAAAACDAPIAAISLIDSDRQWFKAKKGLSVSQTPRELAFCAWTTLQKAVLSVPDALSDERFADNLLVTLPPSIRSYLGAPIMTSSGYCLGSVCAIWTEQRTPTQRDEEVLRLLADGVRTELELSRVLRDADQDSDARVRFMSGIDHEIRTPMNGIMGALQAYVGESAGGPSHEIAAAGLQSAEELMAALEDALSVKTS